MSKYTDYTAYFRNLAELYLGHTSEEKHFFRMGLPEFLKGLSDTVNYPAMLLERYDFNYNDNGADSVTKRRTIAFMIVDTAKDTEDYDEIDTIFDSTETIVDKIINQIRKDRQYPKNNFLQYFDVNSVQATPIENASDSTFGFYVTADLISIQNTTV